MELIIISESNLSDLSIVTTLIFRRAMRVEYGGFSWLLYPHMSRETQKKGKGPKEKSKVRNQKQVLRRMLAEF